LVIAVSPVAALTLKEHDQALTRSVVRYIINNQYDSAFTILRQHTTEPQEPIVPLLKLCVLSLRDVDYDRTMDSTLFIATYASVQTAVAQWEKAHSSDSYSKMISGMAMAINSASYLRQKRYISALQLGLDALDLLKKAQALDSTNYEVDLVLGLYEYGRAELRSRFWWVLFWYPGDRESGIRRVKRCAGNAVLTADAARISLCDLFVQERRYGESRSMLDALKNTYPRSRFILWSEVKLLEAQKQYAAAAAAYRQLADLYANDPPGEYNALYTKHRQAQLLDKSGNCAAATAVCGELLGNKKIDKYKTLKRETIKLSERCNGARN
jgi:hypothetical protein